MSTLLHRCKERMKEKHRYASLLFTYIHSTFFTFSSVPQRINSTISVMNIGIAYVTTLHRVGYFICRISAIKNILLIVLII